MARVLERRIPLNVNHDDSLVFSCGEEASACHVWNDVHDEAFVVNHFLEVIVFTGLAIQGVHFVGEIDGS